LFSSVVWGQSEANKNTIPAAMDRPALKTANIQMATLLAVVQAGSRLVAAGERGIILVSDDDGASWQQSTVPTSVNLTTLHFIDAKRGWAVGHMGIVLHTEDGGLTWRKQLDGIQAAQLAIEAVRNSGDKRAIKEANYLLEDGPDKPFFDIHIDEQGQGFVIGAFNLIFRTDDGGEHWQYWSPHVKSSLSLHLYAIKRIGEDYIIAGEQGLLLRSNDGGEQFTPLKSPYQGTWFGLLNTRDGGVLAYGLRGNAFISTDQGNSWQPVKTESQASFSAATQLADGRIVLVNQAGQFFISDEQGINYESISGIPPQPYTSVIQSDTGKFILTSLRGLASFNPFQSGSH
jgi:photosystem II stability/assembly factor-like uncharacterized protein